ncbi:hypothetical protein BJ138DRAFT_1104763 [Hygrophoropsis aurantiaca]|uniref:Uncharacterized protein n=1 Tax=Hygrophoropsis aurantiaca TaxID=72124 RepID=A0ACB8A1Q9_9AGAM|nr:hypothetical protein BJ138DRAFT_1104763 [Hygrophoropsis aurantiaca]
MSAALSEETPSSASIQIPTSPPSSRPAMSSPPSSHFEAENLKSLTNPTSNVLQKRPFVQYSLPYDDFDGKRPRKKTKPLVTTIVPPRTKDVDDLHSRRLLELARASHDAFVAKQKYQRLRLREIEALYTIAMEEYEEAALLSKKSREQIGELRHMLSINGTAQSHNGIPLKRRFFHNVHGIDESDSEVPSDIEITSRSLSPSPSPTPSPSAIPQSSVLEAVFKVWFTMTRTLSNTNVPGLDLNRQQSLSRMPRGSSSTSRRSRGGGTRARDGTAASSVAPLPAFQPIPYLGPPQQLSIDPNAPYNWSPTDANYNSGDMLPPAQTSHQRQITHPQNHILPQPAPQTTSERLQAAAAMIQTNGRQFDVLEQHQTRNGASRMPSAGRLRSFRSAPYSAPSLTRSNSFVSQAPSHSRNDDPEEYDAQSFAGFERKSRVRRGTHGHGRRAMKAQLDDETREVVAYARTAIVNDMLQTLGWNSGKKGRAVRLRAASECFDQAVLALGKTGRGITCTNEIAAAVGQSLFLFQIETELTNVRSKLAEAAETFAAAFFHTDDATLKQSPEAYSAWMQDRFEKITQANDTENFFLHQQDENGRIERWFGNSIFEDFYIDFWYTHNSSPVHKFSDSWTTVPLQGYGITAAALHCGLQRVATGRVHRTSGVIDFSGANFGSISQGYYDGMVHARNTRGIAENFQSRLEWMNQRGLEKYAHVISRPASPRKIPKVFIPSEEELGNYEPLRLSPIPYASTSAFSHTGPSNSSYTDPYGAGPSSYHAGPSSAPAASSSGEATGYGEYNGMSGYYFNA